MLLFFEIMDGNVRYAIDRYIDEKGLQSLVILRSIVFPWRAFSKFQKFDKIQYLERLQRSQLLDVKVSGAKTLPSLAYSDKVLRGLKNRSLFLLQT